MKPMELWLAAAVDGNLKKGSFKKKNKKKKTYLVGILNKNIKSKVCLKHHKITINKHACSLKKYKHNYSIPKKHSKT